MPSYIDILGFVHDTCISKITPNHTLIHCKYYDPRVYVIAGYGISEKSLFIPLCHPQMCALVSSAFKLMNVINMLRSWLIPGCEAISFEFCISVPYCSLHICVCNVNPLIKPESHSIRLWNKLLMTSFSVVSGLISSLCLDLSSSHFRFPLESENHLFILFCPKKFSSFSIL